MCDCKTRSSVSQRIVSHFWISAYLICLTGTPRSVRYRGVTYFANISAKTMLALKRIWGHICVLSPICLELPGHLQQWDPTTIIN